MKQSRKPKHRTPLSQFFGKWPGNVEEAEDIKKTLEKQRKQVKTREVSF